MIRASDQPDIRAIVIAFHSEVLDAITRIISRYTDPKGDVIFDHPYNAGVWQWFA